MANDGRTRCKRTRKTKIGVFNMQELITTEQLKEDLVVYFLQSPILHCSPNDIVRKMEIKCGLTTQKMYMDNLCINPLSLYKVCLYLQSILPENFKPIIKKRFVYEHKKIKGYKTNRFIFQKNKCEVTQFTFNDKLFSYISQKDICFCYSLEDANDCGKTKERYVEFFKCMSSKTYGLDFDEYIDKFYKKVIKQVYGRKNGLRL